MHRNGTGTAPIALFTGERYAWPAMGDRAPAGDVLETLSLSILAAGSTVVSAEWNYRGVNRDPYARLYHVTSGRGAIRLDGSDVSLLPGSTYLIPAQCPFVFGASRGMGHHWIHFTAQVGTGVSLFELALLPVSAPGGEDERQLFQAITRSFSAESVHGIDRLSRTNRLGLLLEPFLTLARWNDAWTAVDRFAPALQHIHQNLGRPLRIAELAETVHLHPTYFANRFAQLFGIAPAAYIRQRRVEAAQIMLLHTDKPVKEIGALAGFSDTPYFCRAFRAVTGWTPGAYRERGAV